MLGSLTYYRRLLHQHVFTPQTLRDYSGGSYGASEAMILESGSKLPTIGHAIAGVAAGWTVSFVAAPVEHIKARLQVQYAADKSKRLYSGPIDCTSKIVRCYTSDDFWLADSNNRYVPTVSVASTMGFRRRCFSGRSSFFGGDLTTC